MDTTISPNLLLLNSLSLSSPSSSPPKSNLLLKQPPPPEILSSINQLSDLSTALSAFLHDFHDLRNHITSITSAIDAQLPPHLLQLITNATTTTTTTTTTEAIFAERNPNGTEKSSGQLTHANNDLRKVLEETNDTLQGIDVLNKNKGSDILVSEEDIDVWKIIEDIDCHDDDDDDNALLKKKWKKADIIDKINVLLRKEPEKSVSLRKAGEIHKFKEDEGTDISKEDDLDTNVVEKKKKQQQHEENDESMEDGEIKILKEEDIEIDVSKKQPEEIDISKEDGEIDLEDREIDMSKESDEITISKKKPKGISILKKKPKEIDISKKQHKEIDTYGEADEFRIPKKKQEEIRILKRKHEQIKSHIEIDKVKKKHEEIDTKKKQHEEIDNLKKKKKKDEEIDISKKKHDETEALKRPEEIDVSKKPEISDTLWKPEAEIHILTKPEQRSKEDREDDTFKRPAENDASKKLVENDILNKPEEIDVLNKREEVDVLNKPEGVHVSKKPNENDVSNKPEEIDVSRRADVIDASKKPAIAELEFLCKYRNAKEVIKHVVAQISEMNSLHQEIAMALKLARNPARLVLDSICRFFLPTSRLDYYGEFRHQQTAAKFSKEKGKHIVARQASVLILECFVMISGDSIKIAKEDKEYAENAAIDWRKRMINEGGLIHMEAVDARGLLLFISGFGIPNGVFSNEDFRDLIRASNVKEISNALGHSTILIAKLPEVIDWMVKNNLEVEAVDIAYTFGLEDKCYPETILTTFLHNKMEDTQNVSSLQVPEEVTVLNKPEEIDVSKKSDEDDVSNKTEEADVSKKDDEIDASKKPAVAVLNFLCKKMCSQKLKKYVVAHISEMNSLHQDFAKALKLARNPVKLVLDSIGRYFLQTSKAYDGESRHPEIAARQASVFILECFVMISGDGIEITKEDKEYAENAAIDWRKRMIKEGGLIYMEVVDARGLLLFISGFGIPDGVFSNKDFWDLISASNVKEISNVLRHSTVLIPKLPEVIDWMVKNNLEIEAADIAYTFGLEDKCHPETILMAFLHNKIKDTQNGSSLQVNAETMQQLSDLKSIQRCLETHKIDPSKLLPGVKINEKIAQLEEVINELVLKSNEEKPTLKSKEETDASKKPVEVDVLNKPEEIDVSKKPLEETDGLNKPVEVDVLNQPEEVDVFDKPVEIAVSKKPDEIDVSNKPEEIDLSKKADEIDASKNPAIAVLEVLCKKMCAKKMKKHVVAHITTMNSLHQEISDALKLARNPAKLVLDCIGEFFLPTVEHTTMENLGTRRLRRNFLKRKKKKPMLARRASVLILECFLMISGDGIEITKKDKQYAENAAIDWRKRMIKEGGLIYMEEVDARGLLLFISGFGIPDGVFSNEDFRDLIRASNVKEISNALRLSTILIPKLPEVIDWMVKNNLEIEAADIAYTFGLEDKYHPETILMTFLHNKIKDTQNGSSLQVNAATMQQLSDLKSIRRWFETHKMILPGIRINEKIDQLEKVINALDLKLTEEKSTLKGKEKDLDVSNKPVEIDVLNKTDEIDASKKPAIAVLELLCKNMRAKKLKKHVMAHISEMNSLHREIAKALKLAINPAKLVLDSIGRFFLQSSRAYYSGESRHLQIAIRQASVLILECFVMISGDGIEITKEDKEYADNAATDWRKRMIKEGGLICMEAVDARGLLLFISGFGIPDGVFSNEDFSDLIRASNVKEISNALRHSTILIPKLPEVIDWMVKNNLEIEAADIAYTFGLEDNCHPETILMTFLDNKIKDTHNGSSLQVNAATMQLLSDLKSIRRCLETHKIDPSKFLPGVKINEKIKQLEKVINELDVKSNEEKSIPKRKEKEDEFSKDLNHQQQAKRICFSLENLNTHDHHGIRPSNLSTQPTRSYFNRNLPNNHYVATSSASSVFSVPVLPQNITSSGLAGSYGPCVYGRPVAEPMPHTNHPWPYGGQPYSGQSQPYHPYPSFPGLPNHSLPGGFFGWWAPSSDLFRFADKVVERGSQHGPHVAGSSTTR